MELVLLGHDLAASLHAYVLPISAIVLCLYPPILFLRMLTAGLVRTAEPNTASQMLDRESAYVTSRGGAWTVCAAVMALVPLLLVFPGSLGFSAGSVLPHRDATQILLAGAASNAGSNPDYPKSFPGSVFGSLGCLIGVTMVSVAARSLLQTVARARAERTERKLGKSKLIRNPSGVLRRCSTRQWEGGHSNEQSSEQENVPIWDAPHTTTSYWHETELFVQDWLDEDTGLFRYVNEMPQGSLQKFELQTTLENNILCEDTEGSRRLRAFGRPVPFNYGCFPQTYRDPTDHDELHDAPGDDDPLDVVDVSQTPSGVGDVIICRPLGAVCLIDEGQADWKILVVNTQSDSPVATARSTAEVESLLPGRIQEILKWMDDFKKHSSNGRTKLHSEVHGADVARALIRKDHIAWRRLVSSADEKTGYARGHWISKPRKAMPEVLQVSWQMSHAASQLTGATQPHVSTYTEATQALRRQSTASSSDGDTSSDRSP
ncbi:PPA6 [Symbiodinium sp. CCMP2456]|nr:PPA6 [Symbiodinium sp. CCMP2456]